MMMWRRWLCDIIIALPKTGYPMWIKVGYPTEKTKNVEKAVI